MYCQGSIQHISFKLVNCSLRNTQKTLILFGNESIKRGQIKMGQKEAKKL